MNQKVNAYRPEIDGLRAIAVIPVLLFHVGVPSFSGGFIGVDIFFVISGYLITRIIYNELEANKFSILRFYQRRIQRIFPALFTVLFVSLIAAAILFMPNGFKSFSKSLAGAALSVSNIIFWRESGYFDDPSNLKPLLHTWSLGIEEQFYFLFPILLLVLHKFAKKYIKALLIVVTIMSFSLSVWGVRNHPTDAFFLLPYRAWELGLGAVLALNIIPQIKHKGATEVIAIAGLILATYPIFIYTSDTPFPGWAALAPTLGATLLIYAGAESKYAVAILKTRPLVFIGLISYSLYLWHWPIITFTRYYLPYEIGFTEAIELISISLIISYISWRWVEQPFRKSNKRLPTILASGLTISLGTVIVGFAVFINDGFPQRISQQAQEYVAMLDKNQYFKIYNRGGCFLDYDQNEADYNESDCLGENNYNNILIFGDSFAAHLFPGLQARIGNEAVHQYTATSCRPFLTGNKRCDSIYNNFFSQILPTANAHKIILSAYWTPYFESLGKDEFEKRLTDTVIAIKSTGKQVILFGQTPIFYKPVPHTMAIRGSNIITLPANDASDINASLKEVAIKNDIHFIDPAYFACSQQKCIAASNGDPYHWDFGHMTLSGSKFYSALILEPSKNNIELSNF